MQASSKSLATRELDRLFGHGTDPAGDGALLARFVASRDDSAFEALVVRHGPMVLGVCRRLLPNAHDVDDAFQATFLVLARKAQTLRDPDRLAPWLYGVATRVAAKARTRAARHRHEPLVETPSGDPAAAEWSDLMPIVDAELGRLSAKHRDVLVLCLLEGASAEEASQRLGCPVGTVKSRLARGRETLRARLVGRGIAPAVVLAALAGQQTWASHVSATLTRATLETIAAKATAPGLVALTTGATPTMFSKSMLAATVLVGGATLVGLGTAAWLRPSQAQDRVPEVPARETPPEHGTPAQAENLRRILLAFQNYESANGHLPAAAIYGPDGQPKLSWRVALLPYLDQNELYQQFHLDEDWDSPHNKDLIVRLPAVFDTPDAPAPPGQTRFRGFAGKRAIFDGTEGVGFGQITDGSSYTLLLAVAREPTTWTKPGELPFVAGRPITALAENNPTGYQIGMADGTVRWLPKNAASFLPMLITRDGGEVITWPPEREADRPNKPLVPTGIDPGQITSGGATPAPTPTAPGLPAGSSTAPPLMMPGMMPAPGTAIPGRAAAPMPQALEGRLDRLEAKLDRILKKLDAAFPEGGSRNARDVPSR